MKSASLYLGTCIRIDRPTRPLAAPAPIAALCIVRFLLPWCFTCLACSSLTVHFRIRMIMMISDLAKEGKERKGKADAVLMYTEWQLDRTMTRPLRDSPPPP